jgi:hypothetical protein
VTIYEFLLYADKIIKRRSSELDEEVYEVESIKTGGKYILNSVSFNDRIEKDHFLKTVFSLFY